MGVTRPPQGNEEFYGKVVSVDSKNRLLNVSWPGLDIVKSQVMPINSPGNYSLPKVGDMGLVTGNDLDGYSYFGRADFGYGRQLDGEVDPVTQKPFNVREVAAGETYLSNPSVGSWMHLANSGNVSLMHPGGDGVKYTRYRQGAPIRLLQTLARTIKNSATSVTVSAGSVLRSLPAIGYKLALDTSGLSAQEFNVNVKLGSANLASFVIGNVIDKFGLVELSSFGTRVFAMLKTGLIPGTEANVKLDEIGNIEINAAATGQMSLTAQLINLGMLVAPEPVIKGTTFTGLVNTLLAAEQTLLGAEQIFLTAETAFMTASAAIFGTMATVVPMVVPPAPPLPITNAAAIAIIGAAAGGYSGLTVTYTAAVTAYNGAVAAYNTAVSAYMANLITSMSTVVKTT